jgi:hypothetical protein
VEGRGGQRGLDMQVFVRLQGCDSLRDTVVWVMSEHLPPATPHPHTFHS